MEETPNVEDPPFFSSHDEPVVVDNGPLRLDFGRGHPPKPVTGTRKWRREHIGPLNWLVAFQVGSDGDIPEPRFERLGANDAVTLLLEAEGGGQSGSVSLKRLTGSGPFEMDPGNLDFERRGNRIVEKTGTMRVTAVTLMRPNGTSETIEFDRERQKVFVMLVPKP